MNAKRTKERRPALGAAHGRDDREEARPSSIYTVGEVAELVGVSVRTLHHWEHEGVARPSGRSPAGYRLYSAADVERVQRALVYRETGMPLALVAEVLDSPGSPADHLRRQRAVLADRIERLKTMIASVDALIIDKETAMTTPEHDQRILGTDWTPDPYEDEARERWGGTDDWKESQRRRAARGPEGEAAAAARVDEVEASLARALREGVEPGSERANALAEAHRARLDWFDVSLDKHVLLARMYVQDPRFAAQWG